MDNTNPETIEVAALTLLDLLREPGLEERCVASARRLFSLQDGVERYRAVYRSLIGEAA